jgi:hypothetical protein
MAEPIEPGGKEVDALKQHARSAGRFLQGLLAFLAGFIVIFSAGLMFAIGGGRPHLAGRLTVAIAALLLLGWLDTQATRLARRREPILGPDSAGYRRFVLWTALGLLLATVLLQG